MRRSSLAHKYCYTGPSWCTSLSSQIYFENFNLDLSTLKNKVGLLNEQIKFCNKLVLQVALLVAIFYLPYQTSCLLLVFCSFLFEATQLFPFTHVVHLLIFFYLFKNLLLVIWHLSCISPAQKWGAYICTILKLLYCPPLLVIYLSSSIYNEADLTL